MELTKRQKNNICCKNWRNTHRDDYNLLLKEAMRRAYERNKEPMKKKRLDRQHYNKEALRLMHILIDV